MKTKKELNALTEEAKTVSKDLRELTDDELEQVTGGANEYLMLIDGKVTQHLD